MAIKVTSANFEEIKNCGKPVLLDFYADWCGPCRMVAPTVEEIASEHPEYAVGKINVDEEEALALQFGIVSIPTLIVLKEGAVAEKAVGVRSKEQLLAMLEA
ncbi:MAG: thioredoxin [Clostridia bacterium]|nr:thioredoxin [Clostridia bacterium]